jgi:SSS family solute:Na+ symporter
MNDSITNFLSPLDYVIFFLVLAVTYATVIFGRRFLETKDSDSPLSVLLAGRRLTLPFFIATLVATWYGGIFGVTQIAYEKGIYNFITQGVFWYITYIIFAFFLATKLRNSDSLSLPELAGNLFGRKSRFVVSIFNIFNVIPVAYSLSIGIFIDSIFQLGIAQSTFIGTAVVVIYSLFGGFKAIILSDLVQFFVMVVSVILVVLFSISTFGGSDYLVQNLPETHFDPTGGQSFLTMLVWGIIALSTLVDPNFYQRIFAADSPKTAKKGILIATCIGLVFDICTTAGAMYAAAHLKNIDSSQAYLYYSLTVLPDGFKGFFLAGILATILSTLDSYLFIASTTVIYDIMKKKTKMLVAHHITTVFIGVFSSVLALMFTGGIKDIWKTLGSYSAGCILLPICLALFTKSRLTDIQFVLSSVVSAILITIWRFTEKSGYWQNIDDLYLGLFGSLVMIIIFKTSDLWRKNDAH